jgi:hypothetical protein
MLSCRHCHLDLYKENENLFLSNNGYPWDPFRTGNCNLFFCVSTCPTIYFLVFHTDFINCHSSIVSIKKNAVTYNPSHPPCQFKSAPSDEYVNCARKGISFTVYKPFHFFANIPPSPYIIHFQCHIFCHQFRDRSWTVQIRYSSFHFKIAHIND